MMILRKLMVVLMIVGFTAGCLKKGEILYHSPEFTVFADRVVQGTYTARVLSPEKMVSDYQSLGHEQYSRLVTFKFSINEKDNEKRSGADHWIIIGDDEHQSPVISFGQENDPIPADPGTRLPVNYEYTFRVDMNTVLKQFREQGFYQAFDGTHIAASDFKAVYLAGGSEPLTWDFVNLDEKGLAMQDPDGDGIYELTLVLNPYDESAKNTKTWTLSEDLSMKPEYRSDQPLVDALFNLSMEEARINIEPDSTLRTGAKWGGVWTRDVSYSILLAFAYHEPEVAKISLMKKVNRGRIVQDTGSGGAWPVSSDRTTWALAAWEIYKVTGDEHWLKTAYEVIKNTLDDDALTLASPHSNLYLGESSFLDWREQTYPKWMQNADIYGSENLGTNVVHYQAHFILAEMAEILGLENGAILQRAEAIKTAINQHLWMDDKGYYAQYRYGRSKLMVSPRFEALGEALAILFDVASPVQAQSIVEHSPLVPFGTSCIYPQIPGIPPYHNNGIWPFVQSYWNLAAAKAGNEAALLHGLAAIYRPAALFLTNYENMVAQNGDYMGTEINSHRMLWSMAGNLAMVHRVFIGMHFDVDGIRFQPVVPKAYNGTRTLSNFTYRNATLDITVKGHGNEIAAFKLDGETMDKAFVPASLQGVHHIEIVLANNDFPSANINLLENRFSPVAPQVRLEGNQLVWNIIQEAKSYQLYRNGEKLSRLDGTSVLLEPEVVAEYMVTAIDANGLESFASEPVLFVDEKNVKHIEAEQFAAASKLPYTNFMGTGFVEITSSKNKEINFTIQLDESGTYLLDCRYANGTGPWNTDNNCAIRSIYLNGEYAGVWVFPQRGTDEWSDWGYSNVMQVELQKGENQLKVKFDNWNINMDTLINDAMLDYVRLIKL